MSEKDTSRRAVAIQYTEGSAPEVVAKGFGDLADEILAVAKEYGVLIHEDEQLVSFLASLDLGQQIPEHLYRIIAELIAFSYVLQGKFPAGWEIPPGYLDVRA